MRARRPASWLVVAALSAACNASPPMLPVVATPPATLPSLDDIARACAFEVSCFRAPIATSIDECAVYLLSGLDYWIAPQTFVVLDTEPAEFARWIDCANAGSDCAGVLDCVSRGHDGDYCDAHPGSSCDGALLVTCNSPAPADPMLADAALFVTDCAARGMRCFDQGNGNASCSDGTRCDPSADPSCDGNRYFELCDSTTNLRYRFDCSRSSIPNATCRSDASRTGCMPSGPPCGDARCDGDVRVTCLAGQEVRDDCAPLGSTCAIVDGAPTCTPTASDCTADAACSDNAIVMCGSGMMQTIDCSALGLSACVTDAGGDGPLCI